MDRLGQFLYRNAARLIAFAVFFAFVSFTLGVTWKPIHQPAFFKAAELFVWAAGLLSVLLIRRQLHAQEIILEAHRVQQEQEFEQLQADHEWKCYAFYHQHFPEIPPEVVRRPVYQLAAAPNHSFIDCFQDRGTPMPPAVLAALRGTEAEWDHIRPYLDCFEMFCGAINAKLVHEDYAFSLQATRVIRNYTVFEPLIDEYKKQSPSAYCEFYKVAYRWKLRLLPAEGRDVEGLGIDGSGARPIFGPKRRGELDRVA